MPAHLKNFAICKKIYLQQNGNETKQIFVFSGFEPRWRFLCASKIISFHTNLKNRSYRRINLIVE